MIDVRSAGTIRTPLSIVWAFRVASSPRAGGGHVARCLALAGALRSLADGVLFVVDDDGAEWERHILQQGHGCITASSPVPDNVEACLIDGYEFDASTIRSWRARARVMTVIIDHQPSPEWADLIIAPAISEAKIRNPGGAVLTGLDYALIDPRFVISGTREIQNNVQRIFISFGKRDQRNATGLALDALQMLPEVKSGAISIMVALGGSAPHVAAIKDRVAQINGATCEIDTNMADCYASADFVIGGGGVGLFERMAQGLPSVSVGLAENQRPQISLCSSTGGTLDAGDIGSLDSAGLAATILPLLRSHERRMTMSENARRAIDGFGAQRCVRAMWKCAHSAKDIVSSPRLM